MKLTRFFRGLIELKPEDFKIDESIQPSNYKLIYTNKDEILSKIGLILEKYGSRIEECLTFMKDGERMWFYVDDIELPLHLLETEEEVGGPPVIYLDEKRIVRNPVVMLDKGQREIMGEAEEGRIYDSVEVCDGPWDSSESIAEYKRFRTP